ncbi:MAG: ribosomal L7Ae/L30e/S12e/Gadd45 family protein, partial [Ruminococcus sp.]|nr:ribosomal L7Ae/L30e/S12e/Gadd45 family protein [Ruminococcus sp.]
MVNNDRLLSFLGICKRAGRLVSGADTVTKAVNEGKAKLVLYASDV